MNGSDRFLIWFLRFTALLLLAAALAVLLPLEWMSKFSEWSGAGALPDSPIVNYLARSLSALYAALGASYGYMANDVRRYLPLLRFTVPLTFVFALTLIAIDVAVGMPLWWTLIEGTFLLGWTLVFWWLLGRVREQR